MTRTERMELELSMTFEEAFEELEWFDAARKAGTLKAEILKDLEILEAADATPDILPK